MYGMIDLWFNKLYLLYSCHFFYFIFSFARLTSVFEIFRIGKCYWSANSSVFSSLFVIHIMLLDSSIDVSRDPSIEC